jgi:pimeloyl-ACP methyl ester carboxylesterase
VRETEGNLALGDSPKKLTLSVDGKNLEAEHHGPRAEDAPTIVMLHEGLGSVSAWRDWPAELARETGFGVFVYSRAGYGNSDPVTLPRPVTYMHHEADVVLPQVLTQAKLQKCILLGHSDGASISILHAGSKTRHASVCGVALLSPHVFCEPISVAAIEAMRDAYMTTNLRERLSKVHRDVDNAFWGWNGVWLNPEFSKWNIEDRLAQIDLPTLVIQEDNDPYGTLAQVNAIERGTTGPTDIFVLNGNGHFPQRDFCHETTKAVARFARRVLGDDRGLPMK